MPAYSMDRLREQVGESHLTVRGLSVEPGKVEEFARATGDDNPAHRSASAAAEQGYERVPAPLTFVRVQKFERYIPDDLDGYRGFDLGFADGRRIHGEQEYEFERPLYVGDTLDGETTLTDVYQREGSRGTLTFAVLETEFTDEDGEPVVTARQTILELPEPSSG